MFLGDLCFALMDFFDFFLTFYIRFQSLVTFLVWNKCVASPQLSNDAYGYPMCLNVTSLLFIVMPVTSGVGWGPRLLFFF